MTIFKENDDITPVINAIRKKISKRITEELSAKFRENRAKRKYPWRGMWLNRQQILAVQKKLQQRDKIVFLEIAIVFLVMYIIFHLAYSLLPYLMPH